MMVLMVIGICFMQVMPEVRKRYLNLADELGISQIGFWHFNSVDPQMWDTAAKWQKEIIR